MWVKFQWWLIDKAYPPYLCEFCIGQEPWMGCECAYYDAYGPCDPGPWWVEPLRAALHWTGVRRRRD